MDFSFGKRPTLFVFVVIEGRFKTMQGITLKFDIFVIHYRNSQFEMELIARLQ